MWWPLGSWLTAFDSSVSGTLDVGAERYPQALNKVCFAIRDYVPSSRSLLTHVQIVRRYDENKSDKNY